MTAENANIHQKAILLAALGLSVSLSIGGQGIAQAQTSQQGSAQAGMAEHQFSIPAQDLASALTAFGRQSDMQVSANSDLVQGVSTQGVSGGMPVAEAMTRLLDGTGLRFQMQGGGIVILGAQSGDSGVTLDPVLVVGVSGSDRHGGAADRENSLYITRQDLERRNPANIRDVFAGESSVSVGGAIPLSQKVYVNGIEETNLAVSIDGARQNNKVFHHNGTNLIDPSLLKAVRIEPGVAAADAGPGALGGAIIYETVDAADMLAPGQDVGGFASVSYDTNGETFINDNSVYGRSGGFEALGYFKWGEGDNYDGGDGDEVPGSGTSLRTFLAKGAYESQSGHRLEISGERVHDDANRPYRANIGRLTNRNEPAERIYDLKRENYRLSYSTPDADGFWDPNFVLGYGVTTLGVPVPYGSEGETGSLSGSFENDLNFGAGNTVTVGVDFYDDKAKYEDPSDQMDEQARNVGAYAQARLTPMEALRVSFGARADKQWFEGVDGTELDNSGLSGNVSAAYDATDFLTVRGGYSSVWGGISLAENFIMNPGWNYDGGIDPVRAENVTAGFDIAYEGFTFGAGVFHSDFSDARDPTYRGGPTLTTDFETKGYNLSAGYNWGPGFVRLSYTDSEIEVDGNPASSDATQYLGAPLGQIISLEAAHLFEAVGIRVGGAVDVALENSDTEDAGGQALEAYEVVSLFGEYQPDFAQYLLVRLEANNLFDETYADRATYGQDFTNVQPLLEQGRSFLLKVRVTF